MEQGKQRATTATAHQNAQHCTFEQIQKTFSAIPRTTSGTGEKNHNDEHKCWSLQERILGFPLPASRVINHDDMPKLARVNSGGVNKAILQLDDDDDKNQYRHHHQDHYCTVAVKTNFCSDMETGNAKNRNQAYPCIATGPHRSGTLGQEALVCQGRNRQVSKWITTLVGSCCI